MEKLTYAICEFDVILSKSIMVVDRLVIKYPIAITNFQCYIINIFKEIEITITENDLLVQVKLGSQKSVARIQDNLDLT